MESNVIEYNKGNGILYDGKEGVVIAKNMISKNVKHAITLIHPSEIAIENNSLRNNKQSGVNVELGVCCVVQGNGVYDNGEYGIVTAGTGTIKENDIFGHGLPSVFVKSVGDVSISNNRLHAWKHECVHIEEQSRCVLENNIFYVTPSAKDVFIHPLSDVSYHPTNIIHQIDNCSEEEFPSSCEDMYTASSALSGLEALRPTPEEKPSAPFFTSVQPTQNQRSGLNISAFCVLL